MPAEITQLVAHAERLENHPERTTHLRNWMEISALMIPEDSWYSDPAVTTSEQRRYVFDTTAPVALERFAAYLHNEMTNPQSQWIKGVAYHATDGRPAQHLLPHHIREWEERARSVALYELAKPGVGFYPAIHTLWLALGAYGTACMHVGWDEDRGHLRIETFPLQNVCFDTSASGCPDTVYRKWCPTVRQAKQRWPGQWDGVSMKDDEVVELLHVVRPVVDLAPTERAKWTQLGFKYSSLWIDKGRKRLLGEAKGFKTMPYIVARWYLPPNATRYGRSPAMTVLPSVRLLNRMSAVVIRSGEKAMDPPLALRDGALMSPLRLFPGGITFTDGDVKPEPLFPGNQNFQVAEFMLQMHQGLVREAFFVPLITQPERAVVSATQALQEQDERNRAMSPQLVRVYYELMEPLFASILSILGDKGKLGDGVPDWTMTLGLTSTLMASALTVEAMATARWLEGVGATAQLDPNILDAINTDVVADVLHAGSGAPIGVLKALPERQKARKVRSEQAQAAQQQQNALQQGEMLAKLGPAMQPK